MNSATVAPAESVDVSMNRPVGVRRERAFFSGMAIAMTIVAFLGFAPSYYLKGYFDAPELSPLLHWHGVVFSAWMVLLLAQTSLIAAGRAALHRRLGFAAIALAVAMMVLGGAVAITRAQQGLLGPPNGPPPLVFLAVPLMALVVFPVLFGAALYFRRRAEFHKRLILLGTVELITAAIARLPIVNAAGPLAFFGVADLFVLAIVVYDYRTHGRVSRATLWGGLFLIASQPLRLLISATPAWTTFASWIAG